MPHSGNMGGVGWSSQAHSNLPCYRACGAHQPLPDIRQWQLLADNTILPQGIKHVILVGRRKHDYTVLNSV
jgi:hypothetical protein